MNNSFNQSQDMLAKLMASENLIVSRKAGVATASFTPKTRTLVLPMWNHLSESVEDALIGHEIGHALYTPATEDDLAHAKRIDPKQLKAAHSFVNVTEDARIEKLVKRKYPGMRRIFNEGYAELESKNFFGTKEKFVEDMRLIDRINLHFKLGASYGIPFFNKEEKKLVDLVAASETFDQAIEAAKAVWVYMNEQNQEEEENSPGGEGEGGQPGDEEKESDKSGKSQKKSSSPDKDGKEKKEKGSAPSDGEGENKDEDGEGESAGADGDGEDESDDKSSGGQDDGDGEDEGKNNNPSGDQNESGGNKKGKGSAPAMAEAETDKASKEAFEKLVNNKATDPIYINLQKKVDLKNYVQPWEKLYKALDNYWVKLDVRDQEVRNNQFKNFRASALKVVSHMAKEFEAKKAARSYARTQISKTGVINTNKLFAATYSEDIFKRVAVVPHGKNHALVMYVDWSSSMAGNLQETLQQLMNLIYFCRKINIHFEVYAFQDGSMIYQNGYNGENQNEGMAAGQGLTLLNLFSSKMNNQQLDHMATMMLYARATANQPGEDRVSIGMGGTPLIKALALMPCVIEELQKRTRAEIVHGIVLTDGDDTHGMNYWSKGSYGGKFSQRSNAYILRDPVTRHEIDVDKAGGHLKALIQLIRKRCNVTMTGFFLMDNPTGWYIANKAGLDRGDHTVVAKIKHEMKEEGVFAGINSGYDEYYFIDATRMRVSDTNIIDTITVHDTKAAMKKKFQKHFENLKINRQIMTRFIHRIAKHME